MTRLHDAVFTFGPEAEIHTVWFLGDGIAHDWLAVVFREGPGAPWVGRYRHRFYNSPNPWDYKDQRSVYEVRSVGNDAQRLVDAFDQLADVGRSMGNTAWVVPIHGGSATLVAKLREQPWFHTAPAVRT